MATVPTRSGSPRQLTTKQTGDAWEAQARRWLEGKGLRFIAANVNERGGEIDLIMREGRTTVFIEVRYSLPPLCALWRRGSQCDPQQTTQIITDCPFVARAS
ncbi:hypothetical protein EIMP300_20380 [Escherichia coli]|uniref:YraN family protein n=1 Tax=Escherichia coli TaxID=562 RepID=A0A8S0FKC6_ECOLX|nr:hypothetical protein EIMP300_20380 [Escherichia coli]